MNKLTLRLNILKVRVQIMWYALVGRWHRFVTWTWRVRAQHYRMKALRLDDLLQCRFERQGVRCVRRAEPPHTHDDGQDGRVYGWRA